MGCPLKHSFNTSFTVAFFTCMLTLGNPDSMFLVYKKPKPAWRSISKNTFIEGASDVDALVILDRAKYKDATPKELQNAFGRVFEVKPQQQRN